MVGFARVGSLAAWFNVSCMERSGSVVARG